MKRTTSISVLLIVVVGAWVDQVNGQSEDTIVKQNLTYDWPGFLGRNRDSKSDETGILKDWSNGNLEVVWRSKVGRGYVLGAVASGKFYQFDSIDKDCRLQCLDATDGRQVWSFSYGFEYEDMFQFDEGPRATPVVDEDRVYIYGVEGMLHCLDVENGKVIWKLNVNKRFGVVQNFFGVASTPIIHDKYLIVMVGGSPREDQDKSNRRIDMAKPNGSAVVVFDKMTGELIHKIGNDLASYSSIQLYKQGTKTLGVAWLRNQAIGFDIVAGKERWVYPYRARRYETVNASTPVVSGTEVFLSESYGPGSILIDVAGNSPRVIWNDTNPRKQSLATHWNTPVLHQGFLYACHGEGRANTEIRCLEWKTGKIKWKHKGLARSSLVFVDDHLIILDENGELLLVKATPNSFQNVSKYSDADGKKLSIGYPCWSAPAISNGLLYVRGKENILCLRLINNG